MTHSKKPSGGESLPSGSRRGTNKRPPASPLFDELLFAPDRDQIPGAEVLLSYDEADEPEFLAAIDACAGQRVRLERRGVAHGRWAELDLRSSGIEPAHDASDEDLARRWAAGRPLLLPRLLGQAPEEESAAALALHESLQQPGGLAELLARQGHAAPRALELGDPRDLAKLSPGGPGAPWLKVGRLSDHEADRSLRLRVSFGQEGADDAARDEQRHREVTQLAEELLPGARRLGEHAGLHARVQTLLEAPVTYTQHIAYWNAPQGGALFHHDAFDEDAAGGQRGVLYVQLVGVSAWLALSIEDLAQRVTEFAEALEQGEAAWVRRALWPERRDFERVLARTRDRRALLRELALPGCGKLAGLVNRGPEFTSFLADAGHGLLVRPGDALLLPNHGLERTVMHSVFCASDSPTYALSLALREA